MVKFGNSNFGHGQYHVAMNNYEAAYQLFFDLKVATCHAARCAASCWPDACIVWHLRTMRDVVWL